MKNLKCTLWKVFKRHLDGGRIVTVKSSTYTFLQLKLKLYQKARDYQTEDGKLSSGKLILLRWKHGREKQKLLVNGTV